MNINLHIERLVLEGLPMPAGQGPAAQAALERELAGLLEAHGMTGLVDGAFPHLSVAPLKLAAEAQPSQWGRQIARALFAGLAASQSRRAFENSLSHPTATATAVTSFAQQAAGPKQTMEKAMP